MEAQSGREKRKLQEKEPLSPFERVMWPDDSVIELNWINFHEDYEYDVITITNWTCTNLTETKIQIDLNISEPLLVSLAEKQIHIFDLLQLKVKNNTFFTTKEDGKKLDKAHFDGVELDLEILKLSQGSKMNILIKELPEMLNSKRDETLLEGLGMFIDEGLTATFFLLVLLNWAGSLSLKQVWALYNILQLITY